MPVDERTFAAEIAGWVTEYLNKNPQLPFDRATVEEHVDGTQQRHDFRLYRRYTNEPVLTGEIKMPDSPLGGHPLNGALVEDALGKAFHAGVQYCFTWNVRQFVLFDSHMRGVPLMQRYIEGPSDVAEVSVSDDVSRPWAQEAIRSFWQNFLERFAALFTGQRAFEPSPIDQRFIGWLEGALENPIAHTVDTLLAQSTSNVEFRASLDSWMLSQGWEPSSQPEQHRRNIERASRLSCYILVTRLVFYQVLRRRFRQMSVLSIAGVHTPEGLLEVLDARFEEAVHYSRDYETIFAPDKEDLGYRIPFLSPTAPEDWARLVQRIEEFDFSNLDFEVIGQLYERLIGSSERRRFGQFYTSPDVVDLINAFCIRKANDHVLDPACGGGTFLVRAYYRKRALAGFVEDSPETHEQLLDEIFGVDIGAFPAQLSTMNLAVRHISDQGNYPRVARGNFFHAQAGIPLYDIPLTGDAKRSVALGNLDAVVGNPPYIRQETIDPDDKATCSGLFRAEWPGQTPLTGRSDLYAYFFTHAAKLLKPGGYLGFVTSIGWLDTDYGFRLQEFFLRNFRIVAVIESQVEKWFEDARVTTAVTILQREPDETRRNDNIVRFIQLRQPLADIYSQALNRPLNESSETIRQEDMDAIRDLIQETIEPVTTDYWRVRIRSQQELWEEGGALRTGDNEERVNQSPRYKGGKWGQYLRGPDSWFELLERSGDRMTPLHNLALVRFGFKTGFDKFFCVHDVTQQHLDRTPDPQEFLNRWGISREDTRRIRIIRDGMHVEHLVESRFLEPELHSQMEVKRPSVREEDVSRVVINASVSRSRLRRTHLGSYVTYAEQQGWHTRSTIVGRAQSRPWYDLGLRPKSERAPITWSKGQQYRHLVPLNRDQLPVNCALYDVWAREQKETKILWAILNSTVVALSKHQFARSAGVEGNVQTDVISVNMMLVPDFNKASIEAKNRVIKACEKVEKRDSLRFLYEEFELDDRQELDDAVLELLGIENVHDRVRLRKDLYRDMTDLQRSIREREVIAQGDRRRASRRSSSTPQDIADELWSEYQSDLNLLQFPEDFLASPSEGDHFDMPPGEVQVGTAMMDGAGFLRAGTIRVGGQDGEVLDVGSVSRGRFLEALSLCHRSGDVRLPSDDEVCNQTVSNFEQYRQDLLGRFAQLAQQRTSDQGRQRTVVNALLRKALQWRNI